MCSPASSWAAAARKRCLDLTTTIEETPGEEAASVLPEAIRLVELHARIPRYQREMLRWFANRDETTVDAVLSRELEDVACAHFEEAGGGGSGVRVGAGLAWIGLRSGRF